MKRRILSLLIALALVFGLVMTASAATTTSSNTKLIPTNIPKSFPLIKQDPSATVVEFWHAMTGRFAIATVNLVNWYNSTEGKKKKIYVKGIFQGTYSEITVKIQATIQSGNIKTLPDLVQLSAQGAFSVKESKNILYMEDLMAADKTFKVKDKLNKSALWSVTYKGKQLGMPFANSMITMYYNVDAFKAVGLDPANPPKTLAEYAVAASKLVIRAPGKKPTRYGASNKADAYQFHTWISRQNNGTSFMFDKEDGHQGVPTKFVCVTDGTLKAALTEWKKVLDTGVIDYNTSNPRANFALGMNAMYMHSSNGFDQNYIDMAGFKDSSKRFEVGVAPIPKVNANDSVAEAIGGSSVYMFEKNNDVKKLATWDFVKFLCTVDAAAFWCVNSGYFPLNMDALKTKYVQDNTNAHPSKAGLYKILSDSESSYKMQESWIPGYAVLLNAIGDQNALLAQGKTTVDNVVSTLSKKADSLLKMYWDANK